MSSSFITLSVLVYFEMAQVSMGQSSHKYREYLESHSETLQPGQQKIFKLLEKDSSQIILLGETHGFQEPQKIDFDLLKYLNLHKKVRYYLAELDYCQAYYFNEYLETGSDSMLMTIFNTWFEFESQWANKNFIDKIKQIRELNQSLPIESRIHFLGIDQPQNSIALKAYLVDLYKDIAYLKGTNNTMDSLFSLIQVPKRNFKQIRTLVPDIQTDITSRPEYYQKLLGKRQFDFSYLIQNIMNTKYDRDSTMAMNFKTLIKQKNLENEKFYGLWGAFHVNQKEISGYKPLAGLLKQSYSVSSIEILFNGSEMMAPSSMLPSIARVKGKRFSPSKIPNNDGPLFFTKGIKDLLKVTQKNSSTLFKLDENNSPYLKGQKLVKTKRILGGGILPSNKNASTNDYFQYVILVRNSEALRSMED